MPPTEKECKATLLNRLKFNLLFLNRHKHLVAVSMRRVEVLEESMRFDIVLLHEFMQDYSRDCLTPCSVTIEIPQNFYSVTTARTITVEFPDSGVTIEQKDLNAEDLKSLYTVLEKIMQLCAFKFLRH